MRRLAGAFGEHGTEHEVFLDEPSRRYVKIGLTGFGKTPQLTERRNDFRTRPGLPSEYLRRWLLYNDEYEDDVRLHGIIEENGHIFPVISQPAISGTAPEYRQIAVFMESSGFRRVGTHEWFRDADGVSVTDANPANFKVDAAGHVLPIDVGVTRPAGDLRRVLSHLLPAQNPAHWPGHGAA